MSRPGRQGASGKTLRPGPGGGWRGEGGQTVTEYLMILGILTAIIIALTRMIVPAIARGIIGYLERQVVFVSTVAP
jgi:hypothetical protein